MNFSEEVKAEIVRIRYDTECCRHALLSAYLRTAASVSIIGGKVGFEVTTDNRECADYVVSLVRELYGVEAVFLDGKDKPRRKGRISFRCVGDDTLAVLVDLGLASVDEQGIAVRLAIDEYLTENECCKVAYIRGAFLGSGSVTLPSMDSSSSTGYHLEFVFTNYQTATDFCEILSEVYFMPKLIERKGSYIVYLKTRDEISDLLALTGAMKSVLKLAELTVEKDMKNDANRVVNCEMSNMTNQIDASVRQIRAIMKIEETVGLDSLPDSLRVVCVKRRENKGSTLSELAEILGVSKSCLAHRLRKITEIADNL